LLDSVNNKNIHEAIKILRDLHNEGLNLKNFLQTWLEFVKNCLLAKKNLLGQTESVFSNDEIELLKVKLNAWDDADLIKCFEIFNELHSNWSRSLSSNMSENLAHLEIGFMDLFIKLEQPSISSLVQKLSLLQKSMEDGAGFIDQKVKKPVQEKSKKEDIGTIIQKEFGGKEDHADQNLGIFS
jgi:DNA polymerase III gamma/tau subunit